MISNTSNRTSSKCTAESWTFVPESVVRPEEIKAKDDFLARHFGPAPKDFPFGFDYGGRDAGMLKSWPMRREEKALDEDRRSIKLTWTDPEGLLEVRAEAVQYDRFPTVEWVLWFRNIGQRDTLPVSFVEPVAMLFPTGTRRVLHYFKGSDCGANDFRPHELEMHTGERNRFFNTGSRTSDGMMPLFNCDAGNGGGMIVSLGWPGAWYGAFAAYEVPGAHPEVGEALALGHSNWHLALRPGEEIRTGLGVVQFWRGDDWIRAQNIWRRWMLAYCTPTWRGKPLAPVTRSCMDDLFPGMLSTAEGNLSYMREFVGEKIDLDFWGIDAGWFPSSGGDWSMGVGTWQPDPVRYPRGLKPISGYLHANNIKFSLWFEPERVRSGSWLQREHPEWLLGPLGNDYLLDLGNPQARAWLTDHIDRCIKDWGLDIYRQDFNFDPMPLWTENEPNRAGMKEIRHVLGYLAFWDELLKRNPDLLIDTCASGGRRLDIETLRRSTPVHRTDYTGQPIGTQCHSYGVSFLIPYTGTGIFCCDNYTTRSHMMQPNFGFGYHKNVTKQQLPQAFADMRKFTAEFRGIGDNYFGDYYPLTPYSQSPEAWMALQFDRPDKACGHVIAFRRPAATEASLTVRLRGLNPSANYEFLNGDTGQTQRLSGRVAMEAGLKIELPQRPDAALIKYRKFGGSAS